MLASPPISLNGGGPSSVTAPASVIMSTSSPSTDPIILPLPPAAHHTSCRPALLARHRPSAKVIFNTCYIHLLSARKCWLNLFLTRLSFSIIVAIFWLFILALIGLHWPPGSYWLSTPSLSTRLSIGDHWKWPSGDDKLSAGLLALTPWGNDWLWFTMRSAALIVYDLLTLWLSLLVMGYDWLGLLTITPG